MRSAQEQLHSLGKNKYHQSGIAATALGGGTARDEIELATFKFPRRSVVDRRYTWTWRCRMRIQRVSMQMSRI